MSGDHFTIHFTLHTGEGYDLTGPMPEAGGTQLVDVLQAALYRAGYSDLTATITAVGVPIPWCDECRSFHA